MGHLILEEVKTKLKSLFDSEPNVCEINSWIDNADFSAKDDLRKILFLSNIYIDIKYNYISKSLFLDLLKKISFSEIIDDMYNFIYKNQKEYLFKSNNGGSDFDKKDQPINILTIEKFIKHYLNKFFDYDDDEIEKVKSIFFNKITSLNNGLSIISNWKGYYNSVWVGSNNEINNIMNSNLTEDKISSLCTSLGIPFLNTDIIGVLYPNKFDIKYYKPTFLDAHKYCTYFLSTDSSGNNNGLTCPLNKNSQELSEWVHPNLPDGLSDEFIPIYLGKLITSISINNSFIMDKCKQRIK